MLACVGANGTIDRKTLNPEFTTGEILRTLYGLSQKGQDLFSSWFHNSIPSVRPLLLLMDGHSSHYCPSVIREAAKMFFVCHLFYSKNPGRVITRYDFHHCLQRRASWQ